MQVITRMHFPYIELCSELSFRLEPTRIVLWHYQRCNFMHTNSIIKVFCSRICKIPDARLVWLLMRPTCDATGRGWCPPVEMSEWTPPTPEPDPPFPPELSSPRASIRSERVSTAPPSPQSRASRALSHPGPPTLRSEEARLSMTAPMLRGTAARTASPPCWPSLAGARSTTRGWRWPGASGTGWGSPRPSSSPRPPPCPATAAPRAMMTMTRVTTTRCRPAHSPWRQCQQLQQQHRPPTIHQPQVWCIHYMSGVFS